MLPVLEITPMTSSRLNSPSIDDVARYVLGEMTLDEQLSFEVRMTEDESLAREVALSIALDEQLYRAARSGDAGCF
jgi:anti-sigma-K factor RskA